LPESEIEDLREIFISVDKNGDGRIQSDEFKKAFTLAKSSMSA